jgi:hypothetical protein
MDYFDLQQEERIWPTTYEEEETTDLTWIDDDNEDDFEEYA